LRKLSPALVLVAALSAPPALAITPDAREFIELSKKLEPVQCEKQKLRRRIALAEVEKDHAGAKELRAKFEALNRDKDTERMEKRLAQLEPRILDSQGRARHPEDLDAVSLQRRIAFYRCKE
jgi:hypothetical protein